MVAQRAGLGGNKQQRDNALINWNPSHEDKFVTKTRDQPGPGSFSATRPLGWGNERPWERGWVKLYYRLVPLLRFPRAQHLPVCIHNSTA